MASGSLLLGGMLAVGLGLLIFALALLRKERKPPWLTAAIVVYAAAASFVAFETGRLMSHLQKQVNLRESYSKYRLNPPLLRGMCASGYRHSGYELLDDYRQNAVATYCTTVSANYAELWQEHPDLGFFFDLIKKEEYEDTEQEDVIQLGAVFISPTLFAIAAMWAITRALKQQS